MLPSQPIRTSTPTKPRSSKSSLFESAVSQSGDNSRSSAQLSDFAGLLPEHVHTIDTIINRAGTTVNTFLPVYKVYSDLVKDAGEVFYYGKLLKLGRLKGTSYSEKWAEIKKQYGYSSGLATAQPHLPHVPRLPPSRDTNHPNVLDRIRQWKPPLSQSDMTENSLGLEFTIPSTPQMPTRPMQWPKSSVPSSVVSDTITPSIPPSYGAAVRAPKFLRPSKPSLVSEDSLFDTPRSQIISLPAHARATEPMDVDAWTKIKIQQGEKDADNFLKQRLLDQYWDAWRQVFQWRVVSVPVMFIIF